MSSEADAPLPPSEGLPPLQISGVQTLHLSYGAHAQTTSSSAQTNSPTVVNSQTNFFSRQMATHGIGYWLIHLFVALLATTIFELGLWFYHSHVTRPSSAPTQQSTH